LERAEQTLGVARDPGQFDQPVCNRRAGARRSSCSLAIGLQWCSTITAGFLDLLAAKLEVLGP